MPEARSRRSFCRRMLLGDDAGLKFPSTQRYSHRLPAGGRLFVLSACGEDVQSTGDLRPDDNEPAATGPCSVGPLAVLQASPCWLASACSGAVSATAGAVAPAPAVVTRQAALPLEALITKRR